MLIRHTIIQDVFMSYRHLEITVSTIKPYLNLKVFGKYTLRSNSVNANKV